MQGFVPEPLAEKDQLVWYLRSSLNKSGFENAGPSHLRSLRSGFDILPSRCGIVVIARATDLENFSERSLKHRRDGRLWSFNGPSASAKSGH